MSNKRYQFWLGITVSLICLVLIFIFIKPADILIALRNTDYKLWALATVSLVLFLILRAIRWRLLLVSGINHPSEVSYGAVFHIQNIGYMLNNILPFRLGDIARAVLIGQVPPITISQGLSTMVVERVFDLLLVVILFPFTVVAIGKLPAEVRTAVLLLGGGAIAAAIVLAVAANQRSFVKRFATRFLDRLSFLATEPWVKRIDNFLLGMNALTRPKDGVIILFLSVLIWIPIVAGYYLGLRAVGLTATLAETAFVVCIAAFSVTAPSSPGQVGVFEASVTFAIAGLLGMNEAKAVSFALLYHAFNYLLMGVLGVIGISRTSATFGSVITSTRAFIQSRNK